MFKYELQSGSSNADDIQKYRQQQGASCELSSERACCVQTQEQWAL